ncbi:MAG: hypothetical protein MR516_07480 [Bacteroidales bacterium]|nr:hypothetical protein [Bacteroidales bacterium]
MLYDYLCLLERELKNTFGEFNVDDNALCTFLENNSILLGSCTATNKKNKGKYKFFVLSNLRKPDKFKDISGNDYAYLHLKHLRNAIAHGNVTAINKLNFRLEDYSETGAISAEGKINCKLFFRLIDALLKTRKRSVI